MGEKVWGPTRQKCQKKVPGARVRKETRPHKLVPQEQGQAARRKPNKEASLKLGGREGGREGGGRLAPPLLFSVGASREEGVVLEGLCLLFALQGSLDCLPSKGCLFCLFLTTLSTPFAQHS